jgi:regulator of protease activity HflC (stomatin/prohibitin superfamily)
MDVVLTVLAVGLASVAATGFRVLREYERGVIFRLGRARKGVAGPGLVFLLPLGIDRAKVVDLRIKAIPIPPQEVITADNISIHVDAVVYADVQAPRDAVLRVEEYMSATLQLASTTLRGVLGRMDLDEILCHRDKINEEIRNILDLRTEQWGVEISAVELRDIVLPQEMKRAMARQAEAERERRAKVIAAQGEEQAAETLARAAQALAGRPESMQLRTLQTLVEVSANQSTTVVFPIPVELLRSGDPGAASSFLSAASAALTASNATHGEEKKSAPRKHLAPASPHLDAVQSLETMMDGVHKDEDR